MGREPLETLSAGPDPCPPCSPWSVHTYIWLQLSPTVPLLNPYPQLPTVLVNSKFTFPNAYSASPPEVPQILLKAQLIIFPLIFLQSLVFSGGRHPPRGSSWKSQSHPSLFSLSPSPCGSVEENPSPHAPASVL